MSAPHLSSLFKRQIALPQEHGAWVFLLSPLALGLFAAEGVSPASALVILAALAAFLLRQPVITVVKVLSRRRSRADLDPALFWTGCYAALGLTFVSALIRMGYGYLLYLALPGLPVFAWHLWLISRRAERRQIGIELVGSGVLALAAPAAYWVGSGKPDPVGWWLFGLSWFQSAASIVYAYLRLAQRELKTRPDIAHRFGLGWRALLYTSFNLAAVAALAIGGYLPPLLPLAYAIQWGETLWGIFNPALGVKPTLIGIRQLMVSIGFTLVFILVWRVK